MVQRQIECRSASFIESSRVDSLIKGVVCIKADTMSIELRNWQNISILKVGDRVLLRFSFKNCSNRSFLNNKFLF